MGQELSAFIFPLDEMPDCLHRIAMTVQEAGKLGGKATKKSLGKKRQREICVKASMVARAIRLKKSAAVG